MLIFSQRYVVRCCLVVLAEVVSHSQLRVRCACEGTTGTLQRVASGSSTLCLSTWKVD